MKVPSRLGFLDSTIALAWTLGQQRSSHPALSDQRIHIQAQAARAAVYKFLLLTRYSIEQ